eukprot:gene2835-1820_t
MCKIHSTTARYKGNPTISKLYITKLIENHKVITYNKTTHHLAVKAPQTHANDKQATQSQAHLKTSIQTAHDPTQTTTHVISPKTAALTTNTKPNIIKAKLSPMAN